MSHALIAQWKAALRPATDAERRVLFAQLMLMRENARPTPYVIPAAALLVAWSMYGSAPVWTIAAWLAAVFFVSIAMELFWLRFDRDPDAASNPGRHGVGAAAVATLFALVWGGMGAAFWTPGEDYNHLFLLLVLACSLSASSALNAAHLPAGISVAAVYSTLMVALPLLEGNALHLALAGLCFCFSIFMVAQAWHLNQTARNMLLLREDKDALLAQLAASKTESDRARARAEAANAAKSEFLANMSHELRTPLNAILGFSEVMKSETMGPVGNKLYLEYAGHIFSSGTHLLGLINDILDLSRIEAGRYQVKPENLDLDALAREAVRLCGQRAERGGVALAVEVSQAAGRMTADPRAVRQILFNLLSNAIKFTPAGGTAEVFAQAEPGGGVAFGVRDTGAGIAPEDHGLVFQSFGQSRHDIAVADGGTGLGLPIVKGLAEAHGGRVTLDSAPGRGTTVTVRFPAAAPLPSAEAS